MTAGAAVPTPALKNLVLRQVTEVYPCTLTFQVSVQDPVYRVVEVAARLFLRQGFAGSDVRDRVRANLASYFRVSEQDGTPNPLVDFGFNIKDAEGNAVGEIAWSDRLQRHPRHAGRAQDGRRAPRPDAQRAARRREARTCASSRCSEP